MSGDRIDFQGEGIGSFYSPYSLIENGLRLIHAKAALAFARDCYSLQDFALERATQSLGRGNAAVAAGGGEILEIFHPKQAMQLQDGRRPQAGDRLQFK